ncbi:MAG: PIN domain-containing protein [Chromatiales bacterium]
MRLLLDTNVVLDVLTKREPHWHASAGVLALVESGKAKGLIAAHGVTTLHYLLSRHLGHARANSAIADLLTLVKVATVNHETIMYALSLGWRDFEDAVHAACALSARASHIITRNTRDYKPLLIPALTPEEFLMGVRWAGIAER